MTTIVAQATGNWSAPATWAGGVVPGAGDIAQTGPYIVTIDQDITVAQLNPTSTGSFLINAARTINADIVFGSTAAGNVNVTHAVGTVAINGNLTGQSGTAYTGFGIYFTSAGTLFITGNVTGGTTNGFVAIRKAGSGTLTVVGNISCGSGIDLNVISTVGSTGGVTITGPITGGGAYVSCLYGSGTWTITGSVTGGTSDTSSFAVYWQAGAGGCTINGNVTGGTNGIGVRITDTGVMNIIGNVTGGTNAGAYGAYGISTGTIKVVGVIASANAEGMYISGSGLATFKFLQFGPGGRVPVVGYARLLVDQTVNQVICRKSTDDSTYALSNDYPATTDVKNLTAYKLGTLTGSLVAGGGGPRFGLASGGIL